MKEYFERVQKVYTRSVGGSYHMDMFKCMHVRAYVVFTVLLSLYYWFGVLYCGTIITIITVMVSLLPTSSHPLYTPILLVCKSISTSWQCCSLEMRRRALFPYIVRIEVYLQFWYLKTSYYKAILVNAVYMAK